MGRTSLLGLILVVGGCSKAAPPTISGNFEITSVGEVVQLSDLLQKSNSDAAPSRLELTARGDFIAGSNGDFEIRNIRVVGGANAEIFNELGPWRIHLTGGQIESETELVGERLWVVRTLLSYWRNTPPTLGVREELELDGPNQVKFTGTNPILREWISKKGETADLADMPNRSSIPITSKLDGKLAYQISSDGTVTSVVGEKRTESFLGIRKVGNSRLSFTSKKVSIVPDLVPLKDAPQHYGLQPESDSATNEQALQTKSLSGETLETLTPKLNAPIPTTQARNDLFLKLRALFYLHPETCQQAVNLLKKKNLKADGHALIAESLAGAGTVEAQSALSELLEEAKSMPSFAQYLALLVPITKMETKCLALLENAAFGSTTPTDRRYSAQLVVGSNVRRCLLSNPVQADRFSDKLSENLKASSSRDAQLNLLYALGNASDPNRMAQQIEFLKNPDPGLRAAAVHSLRNLVTPELRNQLTQMSQTESETAVKKEITAVLSAAPK